MQESKPTVLVVEDEPGIRNLIVTILRFTGVDALPCADAGEAETLMTVHGDSIQLLVTDVNLGLDMSGIELARGLQDQYPRLSVLYLSGLADEGPIVREVSAGRARFIAKPFTSKSLAAMVTALLEDGVRMAPGDSSAEAAKTWT